MLVDGREVGSDLRTQVCVIGGGAAGITIAREMDRQGRDTVLLESGGFAFDEATQALYDGESSGLFREEYETGGYLSFSRMRMFGGSTNHWFGFSRPLDEQDFHERPWVPGSGWPFTAEELAPYYPRAADLVGITKFDGNEVAREPRERRRDLADRDDRGDFVTRVFYYPDPPTNFGEAFRRQLVQSSAVTVVLHGNCTELEADPSGNRIEAIRVRCLDGRSFRVRARVFVLATGGIENARLLLASDRVREGGLGNDSGLVGRYFMEHPHVHVGEYALWCDDPAEPGLYFSYTRNEALGHWSHGVLCTTYEYQRRRRTLNASFQLERPREDDDALQVVFGGARRLDEVFRDLRGFPAQRTSTFVTGGLHARMEAAPNSRSRVTLSAERDALGMRRSRLEWHASPLDYDSMHRSTMDLAKSLYRTYQGRVRLYITPRRYEDLKIGYGSHHMGTTRMSRNPQAGVVDADCRVHTVPNLYLAGSSVYPTTGCVNPTLTLLALALRLADHLGRLDWT